MPEQHADSYHNKLFLHDLHAHFTKRHPDINTYFSRMYDFICVLREKFPHASFVLLKRMSHSRFPVPAGSHFKDWELIQDKAEEFWDSGGNLLNVSIVDMDVVLSDSLSDGMAFDAIFSIHMNCTIVDDRMVIELRYDIEHAAPFYGIMSHGVCWPNGAFPRTTEHSTPLPTPDRRGIS